MKSEIVTFSVGGESCSALVIKGITFGGLCRLLRRIPGVALRRRRFFWSSSDIRVPFTFRGKDLKLESDPWDDALWVLPASRQNANGVLAQLDTALVDMVSGSAKG